MTGPDLAPAATQMARLLDGVTDLGAPTPCADMDVGALLHHIVGLTRAFVDAARKTTPDDAPPPGLSSSEHLDPGWRALLPEQLNELVNAWRDPAAWEGTTRAGGVSLPAEVMGVVALDELVLHGWDLARATGQEFRCDDASATAVLEFTRMASAPEFAANRTGLFGPALPAPDGADTFDQALAFAGRDPAWAPPH